MRNYIPLMCSDTQGTENQRDLGWNHLNSTKSLLRLSLFFHIGNFIACCYKEGRSQLMWVCPKVSAAIIYTYI